jgi:hypothetical protein
MDSLYAPALLTVGAHEYGSGRKVEGMSLLLQLAQLLADTEDWVEITDKAAQFLMDEHDPDRACQLYKAALRVQPDRQELIRKHQGVTHWRFRQDIKTPPRPINRTLVQTSLNG